MRRCYSPGSKCTILVVHWVCGFPQLEFFTSISSPVYLAFLDASKAVSRVNHWCLLKSLLDRNVHVLIVRLLSTWFMHQEFYVRWNNVLSAPFSVIIGVRQGGILSPIL